MARITIHDIDEHIIIDKKTMKRIKGGRDTDRYSNLDTNYLLTRIEEYQELTPLVSNYKINK